MAPLALPKDQYWRFNYFPAFAMNYEVGPVDNFADDLDELIDIIDDPNSTSDSATDILDRFNVVLDNMGESGFIRSDTAVKLPFLPLFVSSDAFGGTLSVDFSLNVQIGLRVLDADLALDQQTLNFVSDTSVYLKSGIEKKLSVGYGRQFFEARTGKHGDLYFGAKLNIVAMDLSKQVIRLQDLDGAEIDDVINDEYDENLQSSTNVGIDLGVVWDTPYYRTGLSLLNINAPSYDYGAIGENCESRSEASIERNSCEVTRRFISEGRIRGRETHTSEAIARIEGLMKLNDRWSINSSLDLAPYDDFVGFDNQWFHLATSLEGTKWVPGIRAGLQKNLSGSEISSFLLGFTLFKVVNFDMEVSGESVEIDGDSAPRRLGFAFSVSESF